MERRTIRPVVLMWQTETGKVQPFRLVAWRIRIYPPVALPATPLILLINGIPYTGSSVIELGGKDTDPIPVLFEGTYSTAKAPFLVVLEHLDPDVR